MIAGNVGLPFARFDSADRTIGIISGHGHTRKAALGCRRPASRQQQPEHRRVRRGLEAYCGLETLGRVQILDQLNGLTAQLVTRLLACRGCLLEAPTLKFQCRTGDLLGVDESIITAHPIWE